MMRRVINFYNSNNPRFNYEISKGRLLYSFKSGYRSGNKNEN